MEIDRDGWGIVRGIATGVRTGVRVGNSLIPSDKSDSSFFKMLPRTEINTFRDFLQTGRRAAAGIPPFHQLFFFHHNPTLETEIAYFFIFLISASRVMPSAAAVSV